MSGWTLERLYLASGFTSIPAFAKYVNLLYSPYKIQIEGLTLAYADDWYGLYDEPGVGKTNIAQALAIYHIANGNKVVAVTLPTLCYQFEEQFHSEFEGIGKYVPIEVMDYSPAKRKDRFEKIAEEIVAPLLVMTHEMFYREHQRLRRAGYNVLIVDEAWKLKSTESGLFERVEEFRGKRRGDTGLLLMNGTPLHNEAIDAYSAIALTNPAAYSSLADFENQHCLYKTIKLPAPIRTKSGRTITHRKLRVGYKNMEKVRAHLFAHGRRVLKSQVYEIKEPIVTKVPVVLHKDHLALYHKLARERILELEGGEIITALTEQALQQKIFQIISCPELFVPEEVTIQNNLIEAARDIINSSGIGESKVILFCHYQQTVKKLMKEFKEHNPAAAYGGLTPAEKKSEMKKFKEDNSCRMLVANWKSAGAGHNFQRIASTEIFVEAIGVPGDLIQAMLRICRSGQIYTPNIWLLAPRGTVAPKRIDALLRKEDVNQQVYRDRESLLTYYEVQ